MDIMKVWPGGSSVANSARLRSAQVVWAVVAACLQFGGQDLAAVGSKQRGTFDAALTSNTWGHHVSARCVTSSRVEGQHPPGWINYVSRGASCQDTTKLTAR
jgi:hypothetical protein